MSLKKAIALSQIVWMVFFNVWNLGIALADDSDIFGTNIEPNAMIALDSSGSMDDTIPTNVAYNPTITYPQDDYNPTRVYRKQGSNYNKYANSISDVGSTAAQTALSRWDSGRCSIKVRTCQPLLSAIPPLSFEIHDCTTSKNHIASISGESD